MLPPSLMISGDAPSFPPLQWRRDRESFGSTDIKEAGEGEDTLESLGPHQSAIFRAISAYDVAPIDAEHLSISFRGAATELRFTVPAMASSEFKVSVLASEDSYTITCDGWHDEFPVRGNPAETAQRLVEQITTLFDGRTKLLVTYAGRRPFKWELLHNYEDDKWESLGITRLIFFNYLGRRRTVEKYNRKLRR